MDEDEDQHLELVMPFTVCASEGGPYEDEAFCAGFTAGQLDRELRVDHPVGYILGYTAPPALLPQLDLIAMRHRWDMKSIGLDDTEEWADLEFRKI